MSALLIGYARCSIDQQDLTAQRDGLAALGVADNRVYVVYAGQGGHVLNHRTSVNRRGISAIPSRPRGGPLPQFRWLAGLPGPA